MDEGLSVRATEAAVRALSEGDDGLASVAPAGGPRPAPPAGPGADGRSSGIGRAGLPPGVLELEQRLSSYLSTGVHIDVGPGRRKVEIEFADIDDLERLFRLIDHSAEF